MERFYAATRKHDLAEHLAGIVEKSSFGARYPRKRLHMNTRS
jgi:hypothetical protein